MPSRSLQMSMNLSSGLVAINLGSKRRTRVDLGLKNSRGLRNQDFTICEGEIVTKSRDCLSAGVEMSTYVWLLMDCNRTDTEKDCLLSVGRKSFEHDLAARPAALDQCVSLFQIGRVDGAQRFRQRRLDHSGIDKFGHFRNRDRSIQDDHPDGVQAANDTCDLTL
jgi:hypothetical protein